MKRSRSHETSVNGSSQKEDALFELVREYGCPMMDDTPWVQSPSGEHFTSPGEIGIAACWLPCTSPTEPPILPGTCVNCAIHNVRLVFREL